MEDERIKVTGEASVRSLKHVRVGDIVLSPIVPEHLIPAMTGYKGEYQQGANFPWNPMACYRLEDVENQVPLPFLLHGMSTDYFGSGFYGNGYSDMGGIVVCSGGIFLSQQDAINFMARPNGRSGSYGQSVKSFNTHLAPLMNRQNRRPSVAIIYSSYRHNFCLFSSSEESWGKVSEDEYQRPWALPDGWGLVGSGAENGEMEWLNVVIANNFSEELTAAAHYLLSVKSA